MKSILTIAIVITLFALADLPRRNAEARALSVASQPMAMSQQDHEQHHSDAAQEPRATEGPQMMEMHQTMMAEMRAADARLSALVSRMNTASGEEKISVMAELLTVLVQQQQTMHQRMMSMADGMMMQHKTDASLESKPMSHRDR